MERYKKKEILQAIDTLVKANDSIVKAASKNRTEAMEALEQCQESAIQIGTFLEKFDEKYVHAVSILEDYCENIYQMSISISDENKCRKLSKKIRKQLIGLQNIITKEMPDRKEIVFLPYKASMWDSLESVWKAADADENTDAYVIPIPYYDKNPDGSFREEHYEGDLYPAYVPVIRYDKYDFEARKPDVIFIHNPYDECNYVTSVHPFFYSKNLKQYTDKLVYIPYFVLDEIDPEDKAAVDRMKHFCTTPGVVNADKVIVQSEKMRQVYISVLMEYTGNDDASRKYWEEKILGLGSPKVDKVLNTRKEDLEIPEGWMKIIRKPDGSLKKIVFYNTSINALLEYNEQMLRKMESVFDIFYKSRKEIALLWRPHPLIESTLASMRPGLWEEYQKIRDTYRKAGWGIYDDTADMDRAVCLSDAYYGDMSSVVALYSKLRKNITIQNTESIFPKQMIAVEAKIQYGKTTYVLSREGILYRRMGQSYERVVCIAKKIVKRLQYRDMEIYKDKIYFFPYMADEMAIYDIEKDKVEYKKFFSKGYKAHIKKNNKMILFGEEKSKEICIYMDTYHIEDRYQWKSAINSSQNIYEYIHKYSPCIFGSVFYITLSAPNKILLYDMEQYSYRIADIGNRGIVYNTICIFGDDIWLGGNRQTLVRWNIVSNEVDYMDDFPLGFECKENGWNEVFSQGIVWNGWIYFFPLSGNQVIKVNDKYEAETVFLIRDDQFIMDAVTMSDSELYFHVESTDQMGYGESFILTKNGICKDTYIDNEETVKIFDISK